MDPEIERQFYDEIVGTLREADTTNFDEALTAFECAFKHAAEVRNQPYNEESEARGRSLFFSPFTNTEDRWRYSVEIFSTLRRYVVFDRSGGFAIYENNKQFFGKLTFSNKPTQALGKLTGLVATNLIASLIEAHREISTLEKMLTDIDGKLTVEEVGMIKRGILDREEQGNL